MSNTADRDVDLTGTGPQGWRSDTRPDPGHQPDPRNLIGQLAPRQQLLKRHGAISVGPFVCHGGSVMTTSLYSEYLLPDGNELDSSLLSNTLFLLA